MSNTSPRRVLVLYWHPKGQELRAAIKHHLRALEYAAIKHEVVYFNAFDGAPRWLRHASFDAVIFHTTFLCVRWSHLFYTWKWELRWLADLESLKIALPQDEYDHSEILDEWLFELGVTDIFSNFDESKRLVLYPLMGRRARFHKCFTGYVDESLARAYEETMAPLGQRPNDIVYRATMLPFWFGSHGQLKTRIAAAVGGRARAFGLKPDISTRVEDTIVGDRWFEFLMSGRTTIGCESGSSVLDRRGEMRARIQRILREQSEATVEEVGRRMPRGWDDYEFFAISPRHFEAVITGTCQVLVEGEYEGVLQAGRHYIPLKRDLSNVDEVLEQILDRDLVEETARNAYEDIYRSGKYTYRRLAHEIEKVLISHSSRTRSLPKPLAVLVVGAARVAKKRWNRPRRPAVPLVVKRLVRAPGRAIAKGAVAVWRIMVDEALRTLLVAYLAERQVRRAVKLDELLADLLRLSIVRRLLRGEGGEGAGFSVVISCDPETAVLMFQSRRVGHEHHGHARGTSCETSIARTWSGRAPREIVWDHSAIAKYAPCFGGYSAQLSVYLGPSGVYQFSALAVLARRYPERVWAALVPRGLLEMAEPQPSPRSRQAQ